MATVAFDDDSGAGQGARPPISLHPAFPAVVALWFAALLGLGSLVLPVALLERATVATGLASLLPAAAPPLGFTSRVLIALAAAGIGALSGLVIARRVAGMHTGEPEARFDDELSRFVRRPLDIREELGDDDFAPVAEQPFTRRRPLTIADIEEPPPPVFVTAHPDELAAEPESEPDAFDDPWVEPESDDTPAPFFAEPAEAPELAPEVPAFDEDREMTDLPPFGAPRAAPIEAEAEPQAFAPPSLARRAEPEAPPAQPGFHGDWSDTPLESLGLVQLVERLGAALERRRAQAAPALAPVAAPAPAPAVPTGFDVAAPEEAAQAMASYFARPTAVPAFEPVPAPAPAPAAPRPDLMQRFDAMLGGGHEEDDEGEDWLAGFSLPARKPVAKPVAVETADDDDGDDDDRCGSLLAMSAAAAVRKSAEVVRFEDAAAAQRRFAPPEPAPRPAPEQTFEPALEPAHPQLSSADTAAALRAALASLQSVRDSA